MVSESGGGNDTVSAAVDWVLSAGIEALVLTGAARSGTGNTRANTITGTAGNDRLDGATGADTLTGAGGNDTYIIDNAGDSVVELAGGGVDTARIRTSWTLTAEVENLTAGVSGLTGTGNGLNNGMTGTAGADTLVGLDGDDTLDGGAGADRLDGGAGNDTYILDNVGDVVVEAPDGGIDTAVLMVNGLTVGAGIENIRLGGTAHVVAGGAGDSSITGTSGDDDLDGGEGNDLLVAGEGDDDLRSDDGDDTLAGGGGDDSYHIGSGHLLGDRVEIEDYLGHDDLDCSGSTGDDHIDLSGETETEVEDCVVVIPGGGTVSGPMDVQFLQDLSGSFGDDIATVRTLVPGIVAVLQAVQPNAQFGVSSFIDKPVSPFGAVAEWVYQLELAQTTLAASLTAAYAAMTTRSGLDAPEAQIEALMQLALHATEAGFRTDAARFVVLFTDAPFHVAGDGAAGGITTPNNGDGLFPGGGALEDYPAIAQLQAALVAANIIPIFAIAGGVEASYQTLASQLGRGAVVTLTANSSNIVTAITEGMTIATTTRIEDAHAGSGDDEVLGSIGDNGLWGAAGNDLIDGRGGNDTLTGGTGNDVLLGGEGDDDLLVGRSHGADSIDGGTGTDRLIATADNTILTVSSLAGIEVIDAAGHLNVRLAGTSAANLIDLSATTLTGIVRISGGGGNDTIIGSAGADTIAGGTGRDLLTGGGAADTFVFTSGAESRGSQRDTITDFTQGQDRIDISALDADLVAAGDQAFTLIGSAAFTGAGGELRFSPSGATAFRVQVDIDGNLAADLDMLVQCGTPIAGLTVADFLL